MTDVKVDGMDLMTEGPWLALCISDIAAADGMERLMSKASGLSHLGFVCVRNDSRDPGLFAMAASLACDSGMGIILESADPVCLREAMMSMPGRVPLLRITDPARLGEAALLSNITGAPLAVPGDSVQDLLDNAEMAEGLGASGIVLDPSIRNMKSCLETYTDVGRLGSEHGIRLASCPMAVRTWSGEYALSVASVALMRGVRLIIADDLDLEACRVIDTLMGCIHQLD